MYAYTYEHPPYNEPSAGEPFGQDDVCAGNLLRLLDVWFCIVKLFYNDIFQMGFISSLYYYNFWTDNTLGRIVLYISI